MGGVTAFPKDTDFASKGWTHCSVDNAAVFITGASATTLGKVSITGRDGKVTTVDKTWQVVKDAEGMLRFVLHHSSQEFAGT